MADAQAFQLPTLAKGQILLNTPRIPRRIPRLDSPSYELSPDTRTDRSARYGAFDS